MKTELTGEDLLNIDEHLSHLHAIVNQPKKNREQIYQLREKIHRTLQKIKVVVEE